mmetsp:Transcript_12101/g.27617  ORF Transcript_12101/g.27617 Transcript_12101/m.27617 type:complete len:202 (+) Transcript_12101:1603-2208(+)
MDHARRRVRRRPAGRELLHVRARGGRGGRPPRVPDGEHGVRRGRRGGLPSRRLAAVRRVRPNRERRAAVRPRARLVRRAGAGNARGRLPADLVVVARSRDALVDELLLREPEQEADSPLRVRRDNEDAPRGGHVRARGLRRRLRRRGRVRRERRCVRRGEEEQRRRRGNRRRQRPGAVESEPGGPGDGVRGGGRGRVRRVR